MKKILLVAIAALVLSFSFSADAIGKRGQAKQRDEMLFKYASAIRWSEFEIAWAYVEPKYRNENPVNDLEKERFKQIQVTGYDVKTQTPLPDGSFEQVVEIRLINRNTQTERSALDTQVWSWDEKAKRWWLTTGLPDFSPKSF